MHWCKGGPVTMPALGSRVIQVWTRHYVSNNLWNPSWIVSKLSHLFHIFLNISLFFVKTIRIPLISPFFPPKINFLRDCLTVSRVSGCGEKVIVRDAAEISIWTYSKRKCLWLPIEYTLECFVQNFRNINILSYIGVYSQITNYKHNYYYNYKDIKN